MKRIKRKIIVDISVNKAYEMWTTREGLNTFFGEDSKIELKTGGAFEIYFINYFENGLKEEVNTHFPIVKELFV